MDQAFDENQTHVNKKVDLGIYIIKCNLTSLNLAIQAPSSCRIQNWWIRGNETHVNKWVDLGIYIIKCNLTSLNLAIQAPS